MKISEAYPLSERFSMFKFGETLRKVTAVQDALGRTLAIIEFKPDGTILSANENFCRALGYELREIQGQHHRMFVDPDYARSTDYAAFWTKLARGEFEAHEYRRIGKGGREVWIQASYNPVFDAKGAVVKVIKAATDITAEKLKNAEISGKLEAISRAQAVIEFTTAGEIITANQNFLGAVGYSLEEIRGRHHRMFVEPTYGQSNEYADFWDRLNAGEFIAAEFMRLAKGGREIWIQASYNPIFDMNKKVIKVVKFATDITERVRAVTEIADGLSALAENDLQGRIERPFDPAFEKLRNDFNRSLEHLHGAITAIDHNARAINIGVEQITAASSDLSKRTEQQAANLQETAAALGEITTAVGRSAESAQKASLVAAAAKADAVRSGDVMDEAVAAMSEIERSSTKVAQIIGVVDEIAFQTNLLALNAGVEAARAGEAGKGFAVVAQEVRALAQRSAEAAKEIKVLIASSAEQVERGAELVGNTGLALKGIVTKVGEMDALITDMAKSSQQQSTGLTEINMAVGHLDKVTQSNAAMAEEATAAASNLTSEAGEMSQRLDEFQIGGSRHGDKSAKPKPAQMVERRGGRKAVPAAHPVAAGARGGSEAVNWSRRVSASSGSAMLKVEDSREQEDWKEF